MPPSDGCVFCDIIERRSTAEVVDEWEDCIAFVPRHPVVDGHVLVVPKTHVDDATENAAISAITMARACELAEAPCNIITSAGEAASQSVFHLHIHVVPRSADDGLTLPWSD